MRRASSTSGFTLIELSIVLVIIGLIIGGVLVGRDLIRAAQVRATVSQIEKYNSAARAFRLKYNALPGDMTPDATASFGFFTLGGLGANGNGLLQDFSAYDTGCPINSGFQNMNRNNPAGEITAFWRHLSEAKLIDGLYGTVGDGALLSASCVPKCSLASDMKNMDTLLPAAKIGNGINITVVSNKNSNYYVLLPVSGWTDCGASNSWVMGASGITPIESQNIDGKIDDGKPETGTVIALDLAGISDPADGNDAASLGSSAPTAAATATSNKCVVGTGTAAGDTYNTSLKAGGEDRSCGLALRFQ